MPTATDWQKMILQEIGAALSDIDPRDRTVQQLVTTTWAMWASKSQLHGMLQYLYAKRHAAEQLAGQFRNRTSATAGKANPKWDETLSNLERIIERTTQEITRFEKQVQSSRRGAIGTIAATAPVPPPVGSNADANDPSYRGSPYDAAGNPPGV